MEYVPADHVVDYTSITDETHWAVYYKSLDWTVLIRRTLPIETILLKHYRQEAELFIDPSKTIKIEYCDDIITKSETEFKYGRPNRVATMSDQLGPQPFLDEIHKTIVVRKF
jgi:hypothetical protein